MLRAMLRDLRAHKGRLAMTLVAITLGVTFVVATLVISDSTAASFTAAGTRSDVDVAVRGPEGEQVLTDADLDRLGRVPGVVRATGVLAGRATLVGTDGKLIPGRHERAGTGWDDTGRFPLIEGRAPHDDGEVALSKPGADAAGVWVGGRARVFLADGRVVTPKVVGVYDYRKLGEETAPEVAFDPAAATTLFGGTYERIEVRTAANAHLAGLVATMFTDPDVRVDTGAQLAAEVRGVADDAAQDTRESLLAFAAVALLVGTFVIANTFTMLVTQRVRQFALLRAVGASRRQVRRTVLIEAAALGLVGATLGVAAGIGCGLLAMWAFAAPGEHITYAVSPLAIIIGYAVGIGVTALAAYGSARRAAAVPPVAALRTDATVPRRNTVVRTVLGTVLLVGGVLAVALIAGPALTDVERVLCLGMAVVAWLGVLLLAPALADVLLRPVVRLVRRRGPVARLATRNAVRDPRRTAATSSALLVGLALVCAFATLGESMVSMFGASMRTMVPESATIVRSASGEDPLGADVLDRVRATDGVERVAADRYALVGVSHDGVDSPTSVSAIEAAGFTSLLTPKIVEGSGDLRNGVVVGTNEAAMLGVGIGDEVTFDLPGEKVRQRIVGTIETMEGQPLFYLDVDRVPATLRDRVTTVYAVGADPTAVRGALDAAFRGRPDVAVTDREGVIAQDIAGFQLLLSVMYAMFGAAIVIAVFGVVNTLALSVAERTREIGVLRAVGASRRLVRGAVRLESVVICGYGGVLGIVVGVLFGAVMQHVMLGNPLSDFGMPYPIVIGSLLGMVVVGVLSAAWPARRAARTDVLAAIRSE